MSLISMTAPYVATAHQNCLINEVTYVAIMGFFGAHVCVAPAVSELLMLQAEKGTSFFSVGER